MEFRKVAILLLMTAAAPAAAADAAPRLDALTLTAGLGMHWRSSEDHTGVPVLGGLEARRDRHRAGLMLFNNSFGQFSQYYYYGRQWPLPGAEDAFHLKLTGGVIYGYVGEFEDKLPVNWNGVAPAIIPAIGWRGDRIGLDAAVLGSAGLMLLVSYDIRRH